MADAKIKLSVDGTAQVVVDLSSVESKLINLEKQAASSGLKIKEAMAMAGAAIAGLAIVDKVKDMAMLNARYETLGVSMAVVGKNAGYTKDQMDAAANALQKTGISMLESRQQTMRLVQAHIDLSHATELARIAQDAAVIGNMNSSEAFAHMIHGIQTGQPEVLRTIGLNVSMEQSYKTMAAQLGKNVDQLTQNERTQGILNSVMKAGGDIAGVYSASMDTAGKQIKSMERYTEDLKVMQGSVFNEVLTVAVMGYTEHLKDAKGHMDELAQSNELQQWGQTLAEVFVTIANKIDNMLTAAKSVTVWVAHQSAGAAINSKYDAMAASPEAAGANWTETLEKGRAIEKMRQDALAAEQKMYEESLAEFNNQSDRFLRAWEDRQKAKKEKEEKANRELLAKQQDYQDKSLEALRKYANSSVKVQQEAQQKLAQQYWGDNHSYQDTAPTGKAAGSDDRAAKLAEQIARFKDLADHESRIYSDRMEVIDAMHKAELISDQKYYELKYKNIDDNEKSQLDALNKELAAVKDFAAKNNVERAKRLKDITVINDKIREVEERASHKREMVALDQQAVAVKAANAEHDAALKTIEALNEQTRTVTEQTEAYGKLPSYITATTVARLEEKKAALEVMGADKRKIDDINAEIAARKELLSAQSFYEMKDKSAQAAKKAAADWDSAAKSMEQSLTDALMRGFESGKSFGKALADTLKNYFGRLILQPIIQPLSAFGASITNPSGAAAASSLSGGNSIMSTFLAGKSLWDGFSSAMGAAGSLGTGFLGSLVGGLNGSAISGAFTSNLGISIGESIASFLGPSLSSGLASGITGLAAAAPWVAAAMAVYTIGKSAFGMGEKQLTGANVTGTIGTNDLYRNVSWHQDGGWLRGDRNGVWSYNLGNSTAIADGVAYQDSASKSSDSALLKALNDGYAQLKTATADYAKTLGINADAIASRTDQINFAIGKDAAETQQNIAKMFSDIGDKIAGDLLGPLSTLSKSGESASATLTRLATETKTVDVALSALGLRFSGSGFDENLKKFYVFDNTQMASAKDRLVNAIGGLDAFAAAAQYFGQNFLTQAEQMKPVIDGVTKSMSDLGFSGVVTLDQFKALVQGLDLSTEAGANMFAKLMALAPAFKQMADYNDSLATSIKNTNSSIQQQIESLKSAMMSQDQQRAAQLVGVDESTAALLRNLYALQDQKAALDAASAAASALASTNASIKQQIGQLQDSQLTQEQLRAKQLQEANNDSTKELLRQLFAEQDKVAAAKALADAAAASAQAEQQAAQQAAQAAQQLTQAWQSVTDSIMGEVNRIRGLVGGAGQDSYASMESKFAIAVAQAKSGDQDAAKLLPQLSQSLLALAEQNVGSAEELARIRAMTANSLESVAVASKRYGVTIPGFAAGGDFSGGLRLVGERGPELELTGPSRIFNAQQTRSIFSGSDGSGLVEEIRALRAEVQRLRSENGYQNEAIAGHVGLVAAVVKRNDTGTGLAVNVLNGLVKA